MPRLLFACVLLPALAGCVPAAPAPTGTDDMAAAPGSCSDGKKDGDESDVDCGGSCPMKCATGKMCTKGADCDSGQCLNNTCFETPTSCSDMVKNGKETDVDCGGGKCPGCANGKACVNGTDCLSGACLNNVCIAMPNMCSDNMKNAMETDVDCGGPVCPSCANGKMCIKGSDCMSNACLNGVCIAPPAQCTNNMKDGMETDVDCGGPVCPKCANGKLCNVAGDCMSGDCAGGMCVAMQNQCMNNMKDGMETDVDCGGPTCGKCANGKMCLMARDCTSANCANNVCAAPADPCLNNVKDGKETDVDCGGPVCAARCGNGKACLVGSDCTSNNCVNNVCTMPPNQCMDGQKNGAETDVDCGGPMCPHCIDGKACVLPGDCVSNLCLNSACSSKQPSCNDQMKNGNETDVDCGGGTCPACIDGKTCLKGGDCMSNYCSNNVCGPPPAMCNDKVKNGMETDVDCGGPMCPKCGNGLLCLMATDCTGGACINFKCATAPTCVDKIQNGSETDVDCGGNMCPKCANGLMCNIPADCQSNICSANTCLAPAANCMDKVKNGSETDVDCGGGMCPRCANGLACLVVGDCASNVCTNFKCIAPSCNDGVKNGSETDVDCGGPDCKSCVAGQMCLAIRDCMTNMCVNLICATPSSCLDNMKNGMETDVDCGGPQCPRCGTAKVCTVGGDCESNACSANKCTSLFAAPAMYAVQNTPAALVIADFNGDMKKDIAVPNTSSDTVSVLIGVGNGTFNAMQKFVTTGGPNACAIGDFNADLKVDIATATYSNQQGNGVSLLLGNGNGTFQLESLAATPGNPQDVAVDDLNADGKFDLAVADYPNARVSVLLGNGDGTFQAAKNFAVGTNPYSIAIKDVSQDGKKDIVVANYLSNNVSVLFGNGNGTFLQASNYAVGVKPKTVIITDLDLDGKPDLVTANVSSTDMSVLMGTGGGNFAPQKNIGPINWNLSISARALAAGDIDKDGNPDIVAAAYNDSIVILFRGNRDGTFQPKLTYPAGPNPAAVGIADFNGDTKPDLVVSNSTSVQVSVLINMQQ